MDELYNTPEYMRYDIMKYYKRILVDLSKDFLQAKTPAQRDSIVTDIRETKRSMLQELREAQ